MNSLNHNNQIIQSKLIDNSGFSLVQVLVSMGIAMIVALGVMAMITNQQRATSSITKDLESNSLLQELQLYTSKPETCLQLFAGKTYNFPTVATATKLNPSISAGNLTLNGSNIITVGTPKNGIQVEQLHFTEVISSTLTPPNKLSIVKFTIRIKKLGQNVGSDYKRDAVIPMIFETVAATGAVVGCSAADSSAAVMCTQLGGVYVPTSTPPCTITPVYQ